MTTVYTCAHTTTIKVQNISITPKSSLMPFCQSLPASPGQSVICFLSLQISLPFIEFHINRIIHNILFRDCLFSLIRATSLLQCANTILLLRVESIAQSVVSRLSSLLTCSDQQNKIKVMLCNLFHPTPPPWKTATT